MVKIILNDVNEIACQWLSSLISLDLLDEAKVDQRSIEDIQPADLSGLRQCHLFAGIGGWPLALDLAGWPADKIVWTGSCPCQPFSQAGKGLGFADDRHLWPAFHWLIDQCQPPVVLGEQVAGKAGWAWLETVQSDLEASGYAVWSIEACAAGVGAPHNRPRIYWGAANAVGLQQWREKPRRRTPRRVGRVFKPVSWDRDWQEALREFRGLDDGLSYGVGVTDGFRNAIVPPLAQTFIETSMEVLSHA